MFQVEIDEFCQKVMNKNFPETDKYRDIYEFDGTQYAGQIDILTGGFPCQPFSTAGKRLGESDDRHLWPEMLRVIREVQPAWVVGENVAGILSMEDGATLERIFTDLEGEGYAVQAFVIPASAVGAIHRRDRVWIVAQNTNFSANGRVKTSHETRINRNIGAAGRNGNATDTAIQRRQERTQDGISEDSTEAGAGMDDRATGHGRIGNAPDTHHQRREERRDICLSCESEPGESGSGIDARKLLRPTVSPVCRTDDGVPPELDRRKRLKALGNAIVPQVAFEIFKAIQAYDRTT